MKLNLAIPGLLIALLVGCNDTTTVATSASPSATPSPTTPVVAEKIPIPKATTTPVVSEKTPTSTPTATPVVSENTPTPTPTTNPVVSENTPTPTITSTKSANPFDSVSFPKASCGDEMPTEGKTDTVNLYPVFVDYSDSNLQAIKANYCGDALQTIRKDSGEKAIQVGSFTSEERANQFKEFLRTKLSNINTTVGEPTIIAVKPKGDVKFTPKSLGLSEAKFKEISQLQGLPYSMKNESGKVDPSKKFRIALPTYIPDGFRAKVEVSKGENPRYSILYKNQNNQCFSFDGFISRGSYYSHIDTFQPFEVSSIGLGKTSVYYVKYDRSSDKKRMTTKFWINGQSYGFNSPMEETCDPISKREAIKVIESIDYAF
jgi:Domain of unknown function (DUF4367)